MSWLVGVRGGWIFWRNFGTVDGNQKSGEPAFPTHQLRLGRLKKSHMIFTGSFTAIQYIHPKWLGPLGISEASTGWASRFVGGKILTHKNGHHSMTLYDYQGMLLVSRGLECCSIFNKLHTQTFGWFGYPEAGLV